MLKLLNLDPDNYSKEALSLLKEYADIDTFDGAKPLESIIHQYDVLLLRFSINIEKPLLQKAERLKIIACNATGTDHIDMDAANKMGIEVVSLKGEIEFLRSIHATAELTWALILGLVRQLPSAYNHVAGGQWNRDQFLSNELYGKRLGILGYGRIGEKIANYAHVFGMNVYTYDINEKHCPDYVTQVESLEDLLKYSDIFTIHIPYNQMTHHLIGSNELSLLPDHAYLVNTSRGAILNEEDLLLFLNSNAIAGAALDVLCHENSPNFLDNNRLLSYMKNNDNLLITPHIGGVTKESWEKTEIFIAEKIVKKIKKLEATI